MESYAIGSGGVSYTQFPVAPTAKSGTDATVRAGRTQEKGDTVSFSEEARARAQLSVIGNAVEAQPEGGTQCKLTVGGETIDIGVKLQELGAADFAKFRKTLDDLRSGDAAKIVNALSELTGKSTEEVRNAIGGMTDDDLDLFARTLAKLTGADASKLLDALRAVKEEVEKKSG